MFKITFFFLFGVYFIVVEHFLEGFMALIQNSTYIAAHSSYASQANPYIVVDRAKKLLLEYLQKTGEDIQESDLEWMGQEFHTYPDSSLGWYVEGQYYLQVLVSGVEIHFTYRDTPFIVDTNGSRFVLRGTALL